MLYELEVDHNAVETTRNLCCAKDEGFVDHSSVTYGCKNLKVQEKYGGTEIVDSEVALQVIEKNQESITWRVSNELSMS